MDPLLHHPTMHTAGFSSASLCHSNTIMASLHVITTQKLPLDVSHIAVKDKTDLFTFIKQAPGSQMGRNSFTKAAFI